MKPSLPFVSAFALIALLTLPSFKPYAQSTNTSSPKNDTIAIPPPYGVEPSHGGGEGVGLTEIQQYVVNSRAILDSLMRFQDAKINLQLKNRQVSTLQTQLTECHIQTIKLRTDANEMAVRMFDANEAYHKKRKKLIIANIEKWAWRIAAALTTYLIITH